MCQRQPQPLPFSSSQGHHQQQRRKNLAPLAGTWTVQPLLALLLLAATPACVHHASARVHDHSLVLPAELSASLGLSSSGETQGGLLKTGVQRRAAAGEALVQGGGSEGQGYERALQASGKAKAAAGSGAAGGRTAAGAAKDGYSALCVVGKNENRYVREWVEYHKCLGFSRIYMYDHNSSTPMRQEIEEHVSSGFVVYHDFSGIHTKFREKDGYTSSIDKFMITIQGQAYKDCVDRYGGRHTFLGFIDFDEFLVILDDKVTHVDELLRDYEAHPGVSFYWVLLGSSGHVKRPNATVVSSYTKCTPDNHNFNTQFKTFANTRFKPTMYSPHRAVFDGPKGKDGLEPYMVDENFKRIERGRNKVSTHKRATVYHYVIKSLEDFQYKMARGGGAGVTRPKYYFTLMDKYSKVTCNGAIKTKERFCAARGL